MWNDDKVFLPGGDLNEAANPGFRLSLLLPYEAGHPYTHTDAYERLFLIFAPILRDHCTLLRMWDVPGANARRRKRISAEDWMPFRHLRSVHNDVTDGIFVGFYFVDGRDARGDGAGPCSFRFFVGSSIRLDVSIPMADCATDRVPIDALVDALQALPYFSFMAGYGLALSERFSNRGTGDGYRAIYDYALRYPAVDVARDDARSRLSEDDGSSLPELGLVGVNWLTGVGSRFLRRGELGIADELPASIRVDRSANGIVFQLGDAPASGEANVDDETLPLYHALGSRLARLWKPHEEMPRPPVFGDDRPRESLAWEQRFFGPDD